MAARKTPTKAPPKHLSAPMRAWWKQVDKAAHLEPHDWHLLQLACEAFDRAQGARKVLDKMGATYLDRFDQPKARTEIGIERDARRDFASLVRQLQIPEGVSHASPPIG